MNSPGEYNLADFEDDNADDIIESSDSSSSNSSDSLYSSDDSIGITYDTSQHGDFNSEIATDSDDVVEQVSENEGNWSELPSLAVEKIYSFLSRPDQSRMSLVCSRWANEFGSPSLWKTMKFYLHERSSSPEIYPEVRLARKYASMFRHVEIICQKFRLHPNGEIGRQLKLFLQAMESSSQLISIKFIGMKAFFNPLDIHEDLLKPMISFFNSQENLKAVTFRETRFSKEEGFELLKAVFHSESNTIKNLTLRGFTYEIPSKVLNQQYIANLSKVYGKFANLQSLEIDYTQIFEDIINFLHEKLSSGDYQFDKKKSSLSTLDIYCEGGKQSWYRGIPPETWKCLTTAFPSLKVKMDITIHSHPKREMEKFLVREIPLQSLYFRFENSLTYSVFEISALLEHLQICNYKDQLEVLNISF